MRKANSQFGFTLMEIVVATAIFAVVVTSVLALFNYVLKINRRVQSIRQVTQGSRNFTEVLAREIRNGRIDYSDTGNCNYKGYQEQTNQSLAIVTFTGDKVCFYLDGSGQLFLRRETATTTSEEAINPTNFVIDPGSFRFIVRPTTDPQDPGRPPGVQPMVTILADFEINPGAADQITIPYQTTISTDVYDITHQ